MEQAEISAVIPVFNEELNVIPTYEKVAAALDKLGKSYEIIFVDDGSTDNTFNNLQKAYSKSSNVTVIKLRKNSGKTLAIKAALEASTGKVIITIDGDLQNDPEDIPLLLRKLAEGYDAVSGWRQDRKDGFISKRLPSLASNLIARIISGVKLHDFGCPLKAYKRECFQNISLNGDIHRYLPALLPPQGFKVGEVRVRHYARKFGKSKYGISRLLRGPLDLVYLKFRSSYSTKPLHFFGFIGLMCLTIGAAAGTLNVGYYVLIKNTLAGVGPILMLAVVLSIMGIQFITLGFISDIIMSTYYSVEGKQPYIVEKTLRKKKP